MLLLRAPQQIHGLRLYYLLPELTTIYYPPTLITVSISCYHFQILLLLRTDLTTHLEGTRLESKHPDGAHLDCTTENLR